MRTTPHPGEVDTAEAAIRADGFTVLPALLDPDDLAAVRTALAPHLGGKRRGRNDFEGRRTERVYTLVARGTLWQHIAEHPLVLALMERFLEPGFLLTADQAINIGPGESAQPMHWDDSFYPFPRPRSPISMSTIWAVDPFTESNGGTELIPGSHLWGDDKLHTAYDGDDRVDQSKNPHFADRQTALLEPGDCLVFSGTLLHRGGGNHSDAPRLGFSFQYCQPWARTQDNYFLAVPPDLVRTMSSRLQVLLGYSIHGPFMGHVSAQHPRKALAPGFVPAAIRQMNEDAS